MAEAVTVSVPAHPLPYPSSSSSSSSSSHTSVNIPIPSSTTNLLQQPSSSDLPPPFTPLQTHSPLDKPSQQLPKGLPIAPIAGAIAGVLLIAIVIGIWLCVRRRRQNRNKTSPKPEFSQHKGVRISISSVNGRQSSSVHDPLDLEQALPVNHHYNISNNNKNPPSPFPAPKSPPPIPFRSVSIPIPEDESQGDQRPDHIHIDIIDRGVEPIVVSDKIKPVVLPQQEQKQRVAPEEQRPVCTQSSAEESAPRESTDTIMPIPIPRRPKFTTERNTDSYIQGGRVRISMGQLPPPPPPTIPPPAIPLSSPGDSGSSSSRVSTESSSCRSSMYSISNPSSGGRRTRPSMDASHRSISMDGTGARDDRRLSRRVILPPPTPPPPTPLPPLPPTPTHHNHHHQPLQQNTIPPSRRRHQRNPSHILNTSLFDTSDRSAISPPLSPLTVQIPRPSSRSFRSLLTINTKLTTSNVQQYLQQQQSPPVIHDSPTDSMVATSPRTPSAPRLRSRSIDTHRIMIPSPAALATSPLPARSTFSPPPLPLPPVPAMPSLVGDHQMSPTYITFKRPSLSHQQSSSSLDSTRTDATTTIGTVSLSTHHYRPENNGDDNTHHSRHHCYDNAHHPEQMKRQQKQQRRRTMSLPTSPSSSPTGQNESSASSSCAAPTTTGSTAAASTSTSTAATAAGSSSSSTMDQELQAIIADAIAIAAAKSAAIESARQSHFHQQMQAKHQQHYQRRHVPHMDPWRSTTPSTADSSRPGSPL